MMTKAEEQKILDQIAKLLVKADPDGYIRTAFRGAVENAQRNIDDDAAYSTADEAELLRHSNEILKQNNAELAEKAEKLQFQVEKLTAAVNSLSAVLTAALPYVQDTATAACGKLQMLKSDSEDAVIVDTVRQMKKAHELDGLIVSTLSRCRA